MFALRMQILGTRELDFAIQGLLKKVSDFRPLWPRIAAVFHEQERMQFDASGAGPSGAWASLSARYGAWKARRYPGQPLMVRTGRLRASLLEASADSIVDMSEAIRMRIGTAVPYAIYHQRGGGFLPRRKLVDLTARQNLAFAREFQKYVNTDALKGFDGAQRRIPFGVGV